MSEDAGFLVIRAQNRNVQIFPDPANFRLTQSQTSFSEGSIRKFKCTSVQFFYNIPNINARNNTMVITTATQSFLVTVPETFYDYIALAAALAVQLNTLGLGLFTVVWNTTIYRFVITSPVPINMVPFPGQRRDLSAVMGFAYNLPRSMIITAQMADLAYTRNLYITSSALNRHKKMNDQASNFFNNILFIVPVYPSEEFKRDNAVVDIYGYLLNPRNIYIEYFHPKQLNWNGDTIGDVDIQIYDDQEELLYNPYTSPGNPTQFGTTFTLSLLASR